MGQNLAGQIVCCTVRIPDRARGIPKLISFPLQPGGRQSDIQLPRGIQVRSLTPSLLGTRDRDADGRAGLLSCRA